MPISLNQLDDATANNKETTQLNPVDEQKFKQWITQNGITDLDEPDSYYDYRGFWKSTNGAPHPPGTELHFPDTFKQHGHPTFSVESQYSKGSNDGGTWNGDTYIPQKQSMLDKLDDAPAAQGLLKGGILDPTIPLTTRLSNILSTPELSPAGRQIKGPGLMKIPGMESIGESIRNKGINTGNYWVGFLGSLLGDTISGAATGLDPRTAGIRPVAEIAPKVSDIPLEAPPKPPQKLLGSMPYIGGESGASGKVITAAEAEANPSKYYKVAGSGSTPAAQAANLNELSEAKRLQNLNYTAAEQYPGSRMTISDKGYELPPQSGDTTGGFKAQTNMDQWPYNVLPNSIRPRAAQSEILGQTGLKGADLTKPIESGSNIHFVSGGVENPAFPIESERGPEYYSGTGQTTGEGDLPSAVKQSRKPLDVINSSPMEARSVEDINKIPPGQPDVAPLIVNNGKQISAFRAEFSSPHIVMDNFPQTKGIIQPIMDANDKKYQWLATIQRQFGEISKGLSGADREELTRILNGEESANPVLTSKAAQAKKLLDSVYALANDKSPEEIGFIDRYITHIEKQPDDIRSAVSSIVSNQFGKDSPWYKIFETGENGKQVSGIRDYYEKALGNPTSSFIKHRSDIIQNIELDYNKIMPTYLESMAKVIFDRPAVDQAKAALKSFPDGKLAEYLTSYVKNYSRYDADQNLAQVWNAVANRIATTNARSVIAFNPVVHMYHAGQLPANIWPELGTKYSTIGLTKFMRNPTAAYQELVKNGLFSNMIRPMQFQTPMQKFDSVSYYMNMVESIVKGIGYYGFKQKLLDSGMGETEATLKAIQQTKNATATVDPARYMKYFQNNQAKGLTGVVAKLGKQYHQIPAKLVEQFMTTAADFQENKAKAARYIAGSAIAGLGSAAGLHTLHVNPTNMVKYLAGGAGQFGSVMSHVYTDLQKGDAGSALGEIATWVTPGGVSAKKLISQ